MIKIISYIMNIIHHQHRFTLLNKIKRALLIGLCVFIDDKNAGKLGPKYIPFMTSDNSASKSATAFCSYQESTMVSGMEIMSKVH